MTLYFAYGANLDQVGMADRCPNAALLGTAHLDHHRFIVMSDGYATILPRAGHVVHGLLWAMASGDWATLDAYEEVDAGLYRRTTGDVRWNGGLHTAEIYIAASSAVGRPLPGYMERVLAAAEECGLPADYCAELRTWLAVP